MRERLRDGVEQSLTQLANGFLAHPANGELRQRILAPAETAPHLSPEELYRQLLRLVYRFLFLLVSEDRGLISADPIYREHYGVARLRRLLDLRSAYTEHHDLWLSLRVLWKVLSDERLAAFLGVAPLNGELFEPLDLDGFTITNRDLLEAFWPLAYYCDKPDNPPRRVNYAALDVEELGSVYEGLLEYHPQIDCSGTVPRFALAPGSERRETGSYYTPPELVAELIRSALEPVMKERLAEAERMAEEVKRVVSGERSSIVSDKLQEQPMPIQSYQDLEVWQKAMELAELTYRLTRAFPKEEQYGLTSQMRRAATSVPANIAEGWARRGTKEFIQFLNIAAGSLRELETYWILAERIQLVSTQDQQPVVELIHQLSRQLVSLQRRLKQS